jgi:hypothetical protein
MESGWSEFRETTRRLLVSRGVESDTASRAAKDLQSHCQQYQYYVAFPVPPLFAQFLHRLEATESVASELYPHISELSSTFTGWTRSDRDELLKQLARFVAAARDFRRRNRPRRGRPADVNRCNLADGVLDTLRLYGISATKARTGTFALVLEQVHAAVCIPERDVHKAVRAASDRARNRPAERPLRAPL